MNALIGARGWAWVEGSEGLQLLEDIPGVPLASVDGDLSRRIDLVEEIGVLLRRVHGRGTSEYYGENGGESNGENPVGRRSWRTFNGYVASRLEVFVEEINREGFDEETRAALLEVVGALRHGLSAFLPRQPARLHHGGVNPDNLWVNPSTEKLVGLTGFENALYLPPGLDIAYLLYVVGLLKEDDAVRAFYRGYGAARTMDVQRREKFYGRLVLFETLVGLRDGRGVSRDAIVAAILEGTAL